jgi:hypothetical protein
MPDWLRAFAANQPITQSVDAIRDLTQGVYAASPKALSAIAWSLGILAVSACLTLWRFERA